MTSLGYIRLDRKNQYRLARRLTEELQPECTTCGWKGTWSLLMSAACEELEQHAGERDGHPLPPTVANVEEGLLWR